MAQNYFRDYSAELGRYIESGLIGLDGGVNFYGYAGQSPFFYNDYNGKYANVIIGGGIRVIGGQAAGTAIAGGLRKYGGRVVGGLLACALIGVCSVEPECIDHEECQKFSMQKLRVVKKDTKTILLLTNITMERA